MLMSQLGYFGKDASAALPTLRGMLKIKIPRYHNAAAAAIVRISPSDRQAREILYRILTTSQDHHREQAARALLDALGPDKKACATLREMSADTPAGKWNSARHALDQARKKGKGCPP